MMADEPHSLQQLRQRAEPAVCALVEAYYAPIERYLARLVGDPHTAADLAQDTFERAYRALPTLRDGSNVAAWLFQIATNRAQSHHRRQRLLQWLPLGALGLGGTHEDEVAERDAVDRALQKLSLGQRTCLLLQLWAGLSCAEIGALTNQSEAAVKMTLLRARRAFRAAYEGHDHADDPAV